MPAASAQVTRLVEIVSAAFAADRHATPPCFYWTQCRRRASLEKAGRSVCRGCSARLRGIEYPLRNPSAESLYASGREAAEALDMLEDRGGSHSQK